MKKRFLLLSILCLLVATAFCLTACGLFGQTNTTSTDSSSGSSTEIRSVYTAYAENGGTLSYEEWLRSVKGEKGDPGVGIASIQKTGTDGLVDTYTITLTDGKTSTFSVTNGKDGANGKDGTNSGESSSVDPNAATPDKYFGFTLLEDDTYEIAARYNDMPSRVVIPSTYNGKKVSAIGAESFCEIQSIDEIVIPDSVKVIKKRAFQRCKFLITVEISDSVTTIGDAAFISCYGLTSVTISDSVTSIGDNAFAACRALTSVTIGNHVTSIGDNAFDACTALTTITFKGTQAEWNAIEKESYWDSDTGNYTIHCTDGDITKS